MPDRRDTQNRRKLPEPIRAVMAWWKPIAFVLTGLAMTAGGVTAWDQLRPYVTVEQGIAQAVQAREMHDAQAFEIQGLHKEQEAQLQLLAGRSCEVEIKILLAERRDIQRQLADAEAEGNASWVRTMREQLDEVNEDLASAKRSCGLG